MPTSTYSHIPTLILFLHMIRPSSILDVGVGNGKMGFIARDCLDVMLGERHRKEDWKIRIDGIEVFSDYIQEHQKAIYDHIYIGDAFEVIDRLGRYDLIIIGDVLEHFEKDKAWEFADKCANHCNNFMIFNIPLGERWTQGAIYDNPYEMHRSFWRLAEFAPFVTQKEIFHFPGIGDYGCFLINKVDYLHHRLSGKTEHIDEIGEEKKRVAEKVTQGGVAGPVVWNDLKVDRPHNIDRSERGDYYRQERREVEALIPEWCERILDVGCGEGLLGKRLLEKGMKEVIGIEIDPDVGEKARKHLSHVITGDVENLKLPFESGYFDCIIFADVLEHLREPFLVLKRFREYLSDKGVIIASIPNVRYHGVINMLVDGYWRYQDCGILDRTHLRFFTRKEIEVLFNEAGYEITGISENIDPRYNSLSDPLSGGISFGKVTISNLSPNELKDLFVVQYLIRAKKTEYKHHKLNNRVNAAIVSGNPEEALRSFEEHLELHPCDLDILYKHAEACHKLGIVDKAIESLNRILLFAPERQDVLEMKRIIEQTLMCQYKEE